MSSSSNPYFAMPEEPVLPFWRRGCGFTVVTGLHLLFLVALVGWSGKEEIQQQLSTLSVRVLDMSEHPRKVEPLKAPPPIPGVAHKSKQASPPALLTAANSSSTNSEFSVAPQPMPHPLVGAATPSSGPITGARFDADYLQNPKPAYPSASRRLGEEGKVVLRVKVSPKGFPLSIDLKQGSGFPRLDDAARAAVEKWHFIPAKQGSEPVEAWVLVPLYFKLDT